MTQPALPPSPVEVIRRLLLADSEVQEQVGSRVYVGPTTALDKIQGAIALSDAGNYRLHLDAPVMSNRVQSISFGKSTEHCELLARAVYGAMHRKNRREVITDDGGKWLVHTTDVIAGPSLGVTEEEGWMTIQFIQITMGSEPCLS